MSIQLWPHQEAAITAAEAAIKKGCNRGLWVLPTGSGKTVAFASLAARLKQPTLVLVHRNELLRQTVATFGQVWPDGGIKSFPESGWKDAQIVVAMVQGFSNKLRQVSPGRFNLVVIDEAHHAPANTWSKVLEHLNPDFVLGCTATPRRLDGKSVEDLFDGVIYEYSLDDAMNDGRIVPLRQRGIFTDMSLAAVSVRGEFAKGELGKAVCQASRNQAIVRAYLDYAADRPALVFATDLTHVNELHKEFQSQGVPVAAVTGKMKPRDRSRVLGQFPDSGLKVLVSCEVLTEGYDERRVGCVVMARPTMSKPLYYQCVGRGMRINPSSNKSDCLVLDVIDRGARAFAVVASKLFGARVVDCGGEDVRFAAERERGRWQLHPVSPGPSLAVTWELGEETRWEEFPDLLGYPAQQQAQPATAKQMRQLTQFYRLRIHRDLTIGEAAYLIKRCRELEDEYPTPATSAQRWALRQEGMWKEEMTKHEARRRLTWLRYTG